MENTMTFLDFFSGVGGFRYGLEQCSMKCIGHCEIDKYADRSYRAMFDVKEEWYANDITKINPDELPRANLWTAGFPCQDISVSGAMRGVIEGKRSSLFFEIVRLLQSKNPEDRPEWLILENVKNLLSINQGWDFATVLYSLAALGYHIEYGLLNSKFHGVPQNRERVYIVAYRHFRAEPGRKVFPVECGDGKALIRLIGGTQGNRVYDPHGVGCTITSSAGGFGGKAGLYFVDLCKGSPKLTDTARCIKARYDSGISNRSADNSGVFFGCRAVLTPDRENKRQNGRRFKECGEPAFTVNTVDRHGIYLYSCKNCTGLQNENESCGRIRRLTPKETWRLQGFPDFLFEKAAAVNSDNQLYRQAGNGVTTTVVYAVGRRILAVQTAVDAERSGII